MAFLKSHHPSSDNDWNLFLHREIKSVQNYSPISGGNTNQYLAAAMTAYKAKHTSAHSQRCNTAVGIRTCLLRLINSTCGYNTGRYHSAAVIKCVEYTIYFY